MPISSRIAQPVVLETVIDVAPLSANAVSRVQMVSGGLPKSYNLPVFTNILLPVSYGLTVMPKSFLFPLS